MIQRRARRRFGWEPWYADGVVALVLLSVILAGASSTASLGRAKGITSRVGGEELSESRVAMSDALESLKDGNGPANGVPDLTPTAQPHVDPKVPLVSPGDPPTARWGAAMAYDAKDGYVVLFGGWNFTTYYGDTWKFLGGVWTKLSPAKHPSPRFAAAMTYDAADGYVVLFGGAGPTKVLSDTWEFSGGQWTQLHPTTHPSARFAPGITYDIADGYVLLFAGGTNTTFSSDTWTFSGGSWTKLSPTVHPSARGGEGLAYDGKDGYVVMYGGCSSSGFCGGKLDDTWKYLGGVWTRLTTTIHPPVGGGMVMVYDSADGYVLLFGGVNNSTSFSDTWTFTGGTWTHAYPSPHPSARGLASFAYDGADGYVVIFGGLDWNAAGSSPFLHDTWGYASGNWTKR